MKISWILPDREQTGTVLSYHNDCIEPLHIFLNLQIIPKAFILGIPEELFVANREQSVFFFQYARLANNFGIFAASLESGKDIGGRAVVLTLLIEQCEPAMLKPEMIDDIKSPNLEMSFAEILRLELRKQFSDPTSSLNSMLEAIEKFPQRRTFASETLRRSVNRPEWMKKKRDGLGLHNG